MEIRSYVLTIILTFHPLITLTLITLTLSCTHHPHPHHPHTTTHHPHPVMHSSPSHHHSPPSPCHALITLIPPLITLTLSYTHHPVIHSSPCHTLITLTCHPLIILTPLLIPTIHFSGPQWNMLRLTGTTLFLWRPSASEKMRQVRHLRTRTSAVGVLSGAMGVIYWRCGCTLMVLWAYFTGAIKPV